MLIAEFLIESELWEKTLVQMRSVTLTTEAIYRTDDGTTRVYNWIDGTAFDAFEAAVATDPTVTNLAAITGSGPRRLYRADLTEYGESISTFDSWSSLDVMLLDSHATHEGWAMTLRFPDREVLGRFRDLTHHNGNTLELRHLYHEDEKTSKADSVLTPAQRDALVTAFEDGFFNVPRDASQETVAAKLGISEQSLSERLRRGISSLVDSTLVEEEDLKS